MKFTELVQSILTNTEVCLVRTVGYVESDSEDNSDLESFCILEENKNCLNITSFFDLEMSILLLLGFKPRL